MGHLYSFSKPPHVPEGLTIPLYLGAACGHCAQQSRGTVLWVGAQGVCALLESPSVFFFPIALVALSPSAQADIFIKFHLAYQDATNKCLVTDTKQIAKRYFR